MRLHYRQAYRKCFPVSQLQQLTFKKAKNGWYYKTFKNNGKFPHPNNNLLNQKISYAEYPMRQIDNVDYSYPCATPWKVTGEPKVPYGRTQVAKQGRSGNGHEMQTILVPAANTIPIILSTINIMNEATRLAMKKRVLTPSDLRLTDFKMSRL